VPPNPMRAKRGLPRREVARVGPVGPRHATPEPPGPPGSEGDDDQATRFHAVRGGCRPGAQRLAAGWGLRRDGSVLEVFDHRPRGGRAGADRAGGVAADRNRPAQRCVSVARNDGGVQCVVGVGPQWRRDGRGAGGLGSRRGEQDGRQCDCSRRDWRDFGRWQPFDHGGRGKWRNDGRHVRLPGSGGLVGADHCRRWRFIGWRGRRGLGKFWWWKFRERGIQRWRGHGYSCNGNGRRGSGFGAVRHH
jgi:hypothetical protein